jgi:hypothetical protein
LPHGAPFSFDRATRDLWIADVGQDTYEEVDSQQATNRGGENYGCNRMEGLHCYQAGCQMRGAVRRLGAGFIGVYQVNFRVPAGAASGPQDVVVSATGSRRQRRG